MLQRLPKAYFLLGYSERLLSHALFAKPSGLCASRAEDARLKSVSVRLSEQKRTDVVGDTNRAWDSPGFAIVLRSPPTEGLVEAEQTDKYDMKSSRARRIP